MSKKHILIWGNTDFTLSIIETLISNYIVSVVTFGNKNNPLIDYSLKNNLKIYTFDKLDTENFNQLKLLRFDLSIVMGYGKIIPLNFLNLPIYGSINIHPSILPDLRGATPIQSAIFKGYKNTGISIQKMVYQMDAGDLLKVYPISIDINDNSLTLKNKMIELIKEDINNFLIHFFKNEILPIKQDENKASYCKISDFSREKGKINWLDKSQNIHNHIRSFYPEPISWSKFDTRVLNFINSKLTNITSINKPGSIFEFEKKLHISTIDYDLEISELVLEGKKRMSGKDFMNGILKKNIIQLT